MNREEFKIQANQNIDEIFSKIDELRSKKDSVEEKAKAEYEKSIKELESKKVDLQSKYENLKNASDDEWEEKKRSFSSAVDSFKEGFSKIASTF